MSMLPSLTLFALTASITPGPNNAMIMASGVNHGVRKSLPHFAGINVGFFLMVLGIGFGLGAIFEAVPALHNLIKVLGIL
jgi:threonine/homoserine/homoserine lactone efflux protein